MSDYREAILSLEKSDVNELRSFVNPPNAVVLVMKTVLVLLGNDDPDWNAAITYLGKAQFLYDMVNIEPKEIDKKRLLKAKQYTTDSLWKFETIEKTSKACACLYTWVEGVIQHAELHD
ncbi:unnamed protein product [Brachionus calyciflorus]|uniref:Dynein heavy chain coiled coil stalk domain-containing protein n=1 Tax=Brachionus calyciflorus TaxID=104777 RepID=A0A813M1D1_9BILA|nr:unnamed protein product [Brachionus calyciflorus]